jgi:hypothetical protein
MLAIGKRCHLHAQAGHQQLMKVELSCLDEWPKLVDCSVGEILQQLLTDV